MEVYYSIKTDCHRGCRGEFLIAALIKKKTKKKLIYVILVVGVYLIKYQI